MSEKLWIFHYPSNKVTGLLRSFSGYEGPDRKYLYKKFDKLFEENNYNNKGGFTIVINPDTQKMGISICSLKDQYCKKVGINHAMYLLDLAENINGANVLAPRVKSRSAQALQHLALWAAFQQFTRMGWPLDHFRINYVLIN